jgi:hypothetical protein
MKQHQSCDQCGGRFGLATYGWWDARFCKSRCKDAYLRDIALGRRQVVCWHGHLHAS